MAAIDPAAGQRPHTAVVVFHGMGQQRRHEAVWRLVQALDALVFHSTSQAGARYVDRRLLLKTRRERLRDENGEQPGQELVYTEVQHAAEPGAPKVRFYEGYWAPATVDGTSAASVLGWLLAQVPRPLQVLLAPWRSFARLRRAPLVGLVHGAKRGLAAAQLLQRYEKFCEQRPPSPGSYFDFLFDVRRRAAGPGERARLMAALWGWWRLHVGGLVRAALLLVLVGLAIVSLLGLVLVGGLELLRQAAGWHWTATALARLGVDLKADATTAASLLAALAAFSGLAGFLKNVVGDVQQFVTYQETDALHDRRTRILAEACKTLRHVLADSQCERVLIFAHSLGSAVALDAVLSLRAHNICEAPRASAQEHMQGPIALRKLEHLVSCGSPIDKIAFFFATQPSRVPGFERMVDDLRGDLGDIPFSKPGRQPHMHWVNFWDAGDPISGPIATVAPAIVRQQRVDNVRLTSNLWPDIAASHDAYFEHPQVTGYLYRVLFLRAASFVTPARTPPDSVRPNGKPIYEWQGPGAGHALQSALMLLLPLGLLLIIAAGLCVLLQWQAVPSLQLLGAYSAVLLLVAALQRLFGLRRLALRQTPEAATAPSSPAGSPGPRGRAGS